MSLPGEQQQHSSRLLGTREVVACPLAFLLCKVRTEIHFVSVFQRPTEKNAARSE